MNYKDFWQAGYRVIGLNKIIKNNLCSCGQAGCKAIGKHPIASNWQYAPLWSEEQIETMEATDQFATGYGVLVKGLLVIDVDARNGGVESYQRLIEQFPDITGAGMIVETGSGGGSKHLYYTAPEGLALLQHLPDYKGIDFKSSGFVVGPGSLHVSGNHYKCVYGSPSDIEAAPTALLDALRKPERHRAEYNGQTFDVSATELEDMLSYIDPDVAHEIWIKCGMAIHHATGGTGFAVWDAWSAKGTKYPSSEELAKRWHSFGKSANPVTLGTLVYYAEAAGWTRAVTFEPNEPMDFPEDDNADIDIRGIDLKRPPGFVGEVSQWIHDQCFSYRENIAVGAALVAMGNIVGLKYRETMRNTTANLIVFCVAASGTGKESILQAAMNVVKVSGLNRAAHGAIKSEQEIVRNLIDHQASFYMIDEIGYLLTKIKNAQTKGTASYLEGIIGIIMSIYSKANGDLLISGDVRKEIRKGILQEIAQIERQLENGSNPIFELKLQQREAALTSIENGIVNPFISLLGFTTDTNFDKIVDYENTANGFIGRSLIFAETKSVPKEKENFEPRPMPEKMQNTLVDLYQAGSFSVIQNDRIENYGDKIEIPTTDDGKALLKKVMRIMHEQAEYHSEKSGMEAIWLRSREQIAKVSFILAVPEGIRTVEHIRWAYALIRKDIEYKINLVIGNDRQKDEPKTALLSSLDNVLSGDDGETLGVILNKLRKYKKEDVEAALTMLVDRKMVTLETNIHPKRKITIKRYRKVKK